MLIFKYISEHTVRVRLSPPEPTGEDKIPPPASPSYLAAPRGGSKLTTRFSYFDNKKVSKMEARASREAHRSRYTQLYSFKYESISIRLTP